MAFKGGEDVHLQLAKAQAEAADAARRREQAQRDLADLNQKRTQRKALAKVELQRKQQADLEEARRKANAERDLKAHKEMLANAQSSLAKQQYDSAIALLQSAKQLRADPEVDRLLTQARGDQAKAEAPSKAPRPSKSWICAKPRKKRRKEAAEAEAVKNRKLYEDSLAKADAALTAKDFKVAAAHYEAAGKVFSTPAVQAGLQKARRAQTADQAKSDQRAAEQKKLADLKQLKDDAAKATAAKKHDDAVRLLTQAKQVAPTDVEVLSALNKAKAAQADAATTARAGG